MASVPAASAVQADATTASMAAAVDDKRVRWRAMQEGIRPQDAGSAAATATFYDTFYETIGRDLKRSPRSRRATGVIGSGGHLVCGFLPERGWLRWHPALAGCHLETPATNRFNGFPLRRHASR